MQRMWNNKPLLRIMRKRYIEAQKKKGINFSQAKTFWSSKREILDLYKSKLENKYVDYPAYFTAPIHTYDNGHLNWNQAYQTTCHMESSALMSIKDITGDPTFQCSPEQAYTIYKTHIVNSIKEELKDIHVENIADLGCGTGETTELLALNYPDSYIAGMDLSPNYLSMAMYKFRDSNIQWFHANMEFTDFENDSFEVVVVCYAFHEMIPDAIRNTINEAYRILKPNGKVIIIDMDPEKLPKFPNFIDVSEPHLKQFRNVRFLEHLRNAGFIKYERKHLHQMSSLFVGTKV